jgi:hypothetical protein
VGEEGGAEEGRRERKRLFCFITKLDGNYPETARCSE